MFVIRDGLVDQHARRYERGNDNCGNCFSLSCCFCLAIANLTVGSILLTTGFTINRSKPGWKPYTTLVVTGGGFLCIGGILLIGVIAWFARRQVRKRRERKEKRRTCGHLILSLHRAPSNERDLTHNLLANLNLDKEREELINNLDCTSRNSCRSDRRNFANSVSKSRQNSRESIQKVISRQNSRDAQTMFSTGLNSKQSDVNHTKDVHPSKLTKRESSKDSRQMFAGIQNIDECQPMITSRQNSRDSQQMMSIAREVRPLMAARSNSRDSKTMVLIT